MKIHNKNALILCVLGGVLLIASGASGVIGLIDELAQALYAILELSLVLTIENFMAGLATITILSGAVVIVGGIVLTTSHTRAGRIIVNLAITMGIIGLMMILIQSVITGTISMELTMQLQQSLGWVGAILAFIARIIAEQKSLVDS